MTPVSPGDRGPAVEDIQRRLLSLGYDLGRSGVDGVFLGETLAAVRHFQQEHGLVEDGVVGPETWPVLVDETFSLGDRLLFLRFPYMHGRDVRLLQGALNALGFSCGPPDGMFGAFTERAVKEFQRNTGQSDDGIAGSETVRALMNLKHVWGDKHPNAPAELKAAPARAAELLGSVTVRLVYMDEDGREIAERVANLATASQGDARVDVVPSAERASASSGVTLLIGHLLADRASLVPVAAAGPDADALASRVLVALRSAERGLEVQIDLSQADLNDERERQRVAVGVLDGLCAALAGPGSVL